LQFQEDHLTEKTDRIILNNQSAKTRYAGTGYNFLRGRKVNKMENAKKTYTGLNAGSSEITPAIYMEL
jgi:hypothetical protein